jgi:curved DNA-binding protein CbpA
MTTQSTGRRLAGSLATDDLNRVVRAIHLDRGSGVLEVLPEDGTKKRLFFILGELYLPPSNPIAVQLADLLADKRDADLRRLMGRFARVIGTWKEGSYSFDPGPAGVPPDAIGPLLTRELVMTATTQDLSSEQMADQLGGDKARWVTSAKPDALTQGGDTGSPAQGLEPREAFLLERLRNHPVSVAEVVQLSGLSRDEALRALSRLQAIRLIEREARPTVNRELVSLQLLDRFLERVKSELESRPMQLSAEEHRAQLADLLSRLGEMGHYELLRVRRDCGLDAIHKAYNELARTVHPVHAETLGLAGREEGMYLLFERATESYLVLSDPQRRAHYDRELVTGGVAAAQSPEQRAEERARRAKDHFQRAQDLVRREEYHYAMEVLREAVRLEARPQYFVLMAQVQERNPKWLSQATDNYRHALKLDPENLDVRMAMAQLYERLGDLNRARAAFRSILIRKPEHTEASEGLDRLGKEGTRGRGLLGQFFGRD